ncbi:accessory factor associated with RNA polymerase II [Umbelopsis nana]
MATASPLALLRECIRNNRSVELKDSNNQVVRSVADAQVIVLGDVSLPRTTATNFKKSSSQSEFYTLDTLIFLYLNSELDNSTYIRECRDKSIDNVAIIDRRKALDYLTGKVETVPNVVEPSGEKRSASEVVDKGKEEGAKRVKMAPTAKDSDNVDFVKKVLAQERQIKTKITILRGIKNFEKLPSTVANILSGKVDANKAAAAATAKPSSQPAKSAPAAVKGKSKPMGRESKIPIMIVPAAPTAMLTLFNIKQFLEGQEFVDSQVMRDQGMKKPERVTIERRKANGQVVPYHVVDSAVNFRQNDWDRVVCVFVAGQQWQFKGWKWEKPLELFSNVKGVYPKWQTDTLQGPVKDWAVSQLNIHRHKRHMDKAVVSGFWDMLDSYNATHRSHLNF